MVALLGSPQYPAAGADRAHKTTAASLAAPLASPGWTSNLQAIEDRDLTGGQVHASIVFGVERWVWRHEHRFGREDGSIAY